MKPSTFKRILEKRLKKMQETLGNKAQEYSKGGDRLHNFKIAARMNDSSQAEALWGMAMKHLVCVDDMVKGRTVATKEMVDEKIGDMMNYLVLLEAVLTEHVYEPQYRAFPDGRKL